MTINERLAESGHLIAFDDAAAMGERHEMVEILIVIEIEPETALKTVDKILAHPTRYGRLKPQ